MQPLDAALWEDIGDQLRQLDALLIQTLARENEVLTKLTDYIISHPGKRLRPVLMFYTACCLGATGEAIVKAAAAYELVHMASLVHDDIVDDSPWRRGAPSVYSRWGAKTAVLYGDFLFAQALSLAGQCGGEFVRRLGQAIEQLVAAEFEQQAGLYGVNDDEVAYMRRIEKKTASLLSGCCAAVAQMCGADALHQDALTRYGWALGLAYQITDDILDLVGGEAQTGKTPLSDLSHGLVTLPVIHALRTSPQRDYLARLLADHRVLSRGECTQVVTWLQENGSLTYAAARAADYAAKAADCLQVLPASPARDSLARLAWYCVKREK